MCIAITIAAGKWGLRRDEIAPSETKGTHQEGGSRESGKSCE